MITKAEQDQQEQQTKIQALSPTRDWRYFTFYIGHVQTLGTEAAGAMVRRMAAADAAAADVSPDEAEGIRHAYVDLAVPILPANIDGLRALHQIRRALQFCPRVTQ
jgi:hypothetical protein